MVTGALRAAAGGLARVARAGGAPTPAARRGAAGGGSASGGAAPSGLSGHAHDVNEPGGRLFGEPLRAPGERRVWYDWEYTQYASFLTATVLVVVGLGSRPGKTFKETVDEDAARRVADGKV
ncbi:hypothetical protein MMPV_005420 [Pyropia vietnamensis]